MAKRKEKVASDKYSSFWFDDDYQTDDFLTAEERKEQEEENKKTARFFELLKLNSFRLSCKNFVQILTGRDDISVEYKDGDNSYTDGKTVVLSAKVENNFDSTVGLALHEASHICLTNFSILESLFQNKEYRRNLISTESIEKIVAIIPKIADCHYDRILGISADRTLTEEKAQAQVLLIKYFKEILNWIEDRRIDNHIYKNAYGYRGYYEALYNRYFWSDEITAIIQAGKAFKDESFESYMFRLMNLIHPDSDSTALKGLNEIRKTIGLNDIDRLKSTEDVEKVAVKVLDIICRNITKINPENFKSVCNEIEGIGFDIDGESQGQPLTIEEMAERLGIPKSKLKKLIKKLMEQRDFSNGKADKKGLTSSERIVMNNLSENNVELELVSGEEFHGQTCQVLYIEKLTDSLIYGEFSGLFNSSSYHTKVTAGVVAEGFNLGRMLGKRLQVRNEERSLKHTRMNSGKIDRRLVSSLGYDNENVFSKIDIDRFSKAHIHISIDASGSMNGDKIDNAVRMATAVCVACKMVSNLECVVSVRAVNKRLPVVYIAYDSRRNTLSHISHFFPLIATSGTTPESLCYESIMKRSFPKIGRDEQLYFINLSDGEPTFHYSAGKLSFYYSGKSALAHCKRMVKKMISNYGATILSYFVSYGGSYGNYHTEDFREMYGTENSFFINIQGIESIATTMNKKFLEGSAKKSDGVFS